MVFQRCLSLLRYTDLSNTCQDFVAEAVEPDSGQSKRAQELLRRLFDGMDADDSGSVDRGEFVHFFASGKAAQIVGKGTASIDLPSAAVSQSAADDSTEVVEVPSAPEPVLGKAQIQWLTRFFEQLDADGSGAVSHDELVQGLRRDPKVADLLDMPKEASAVERMAFEARVWKAMDANRDQTITCAEFVHYFASGKASLAGRGQLAWQQLRGTLGQGATAAAWRGQDKLPWVQSAEDLVGEWFAVIDTDHSGTIDRGEAASVCI
jgi:Ca2+-binding EF-hand superfamily protein